METGLNLAVVAAIAASVVLWSLVSGRLERWNISAPMAFVAIGLAVGNRPLHLVEVRLGSQGLRELAEIALAVVLFGDAATVSVGKLRRDVALPGRLLLVGLPLTMALGAVAAHWLLPGLSWWVCGVIGAAVAPTDAALGAAIMEDERVPARIRRVLNVESGLNDGIATPFVNFFLVLAVAGTALETSSPAHAVAELAVGAGVGAAVGAIGGWSIVRARAIGISGDVYRKLGVAAMSILSYALVVEIGGNGFVAAFVAGLAYSAVTPAVHESEASLEFTHDAARTLSLVVWFIFGAVLVPTLHDASWRDLVFGIAALTVVRMVPVALSLLGAGFDAASVGLVGWFGPRGLASVVFALLALGELAPSDGQRVVTVITTTVVMSVALHGVSAAPIARRFGATHRERASP